MPQVAKMARKKRRNNNNNDENISEALKKCQICNDDPQPDIKMTNETPPELLAKWPKTNLKVPIVIVHKQSLILKEHVTNFTNLLKQIQQYQKQGTGKCFLRSITNNHLKFGFDSFETRKFMLARLAENEIPYHTFGHPDKRMMKVVMKNLPADTDLNAIKEHLQNASIPVVRLHKMHTSHIDEHKTMLILVVLPNNPEGQKILLVTHILGHAVKLEPPHTQIIQCHRCQKWGHSQRFCHGEEKCVKCGGDHLSQKCKKEAKDLPMCANCGGAHTANYKKCSHYPESHEYKKTQKEKKLRKSLEINPKLLQHSRFKFTDIAQTL